MGIDDSTPSWSARLGLAFRVFFNAAFAREVASGLDALKAEPKPAPKPDQPRQESVGSGLFVLSALQREGRLIDFLRQDVASFPDAEVGAAARVVHGGCRKVLEQYFDFEPALPQEEGSTVTVPQGFDAQRIRLTGNLTGRPPFKGTLKHHGWIASQVRLPELAEGLDPRIVAPAEVELG